MLRIGLVGSGTQAERHLAGYARFPERALVTAIHDPGREGVHEPALRAGGAAIAPTLDALIAHTDLDAIDICLPLERRAEAIIAALRSGKGVRSATPLAATAEESARIVRTARETGLHVSCAHTQLFQPAIGLARRLLEDGAIGTIYMARTTDCAREDRPAGGELLAVGYHPASVMRYLLALNGQRPEAITAVLAHNRRRGEDGEDGAQALIQFSGGAIGHLLTSRGFSMPPGFHTFHLVGEGGQLFGHDEVLLYLPPGAPAAEHLSAPAVDREEAAIGSFLDSLSGDTPPLQDEVDGAETLTLILAAYQSGHQGRSMPIAPAPAR